MLKDSCIGAHAAGLCNLAFSGECRGGHIGIREGNVMKKLTRDEIKERVEKIRQGIGDDDEVSLWVEEISASIPNSQVIGTIMAGNGISVDEIVDRLYRPDVIYL